MTTIKRFALALAFSFFLFCSAQAQTPTVSTINVTPDEQKVRVSALGDAFDLRVSVSDEAGEIVFEGGPVSGTGLDWAMTDAQGRRVPAGTYTLSVTYRTSNGKLKRRVEQVLVTEEVAGSTSAAAEDPTPQAVGTITGQGTIGRITKFTGTNAVGNSVLTESSGRIGLGTIAPAQSLHVLGASSRLRLQSSGSGSLTSTEYVTNNRVWQAGAGGSTAAAGVASKFFIYDQTANLYRLVIDTAGNFGLGTLSPASRLTVNGMIQIVGPTTNGIKFADGSIQTKAIAGTINGTGTANRLAKFTGPNSFGNSAITEVSGWVGIGTTNPRVKLQVEAGDGGTGVVSNGGLAIHGVTTSGIGVWGESISGVGVVGSSSSGLAGRFLGAVEVSGNLHVMSNVGIGTPSPVRTFHVNGRARVGTIPLEASAAAVCFNAQGDLLQCGASSLRLKTNVRPFLGGLDIIRRLRPINFDWKESGLADVGLGAEEVAEVAPSPAIVNAEGETQGVRYERLNMVLINAVKEQQSQIEQLRAQLLQQQAQLDQVRRAVRRRAAKR